MRLILPALGALALLAACSGQSGEVAAPDAIDRMEKAEVEAIVKEYLIREPEVLIAAFGELEKREAAIKVARAEALWPELLKAKDDPVDAWEIVESKIKVIYATADFLWSNEFTPEFALNYGLGAGLGIVFGDLIREQATPPPGGSGASDPYDWVPCPGQNQGQFCGDDNDHYNGYTEPNWANGGSKPLVFPWFAIQTGLRYKPHRNFVARLDLGFGTSGFFFGIGADYGL